MRVEGSKVIYPKKKPAMPVITSARNEQTSKRIARIAGRTLANKKANKFVKSLAASALTQAANKNAAVYNQKKCWVLLDVKNKHIACMTDKAKWTFGFKSGDHWVRGTVMWRKPARP